MNAFPCNALLQFPLCAAQKTISPHLTLWYDTLCRQNYVTQNKGITSGAKAAKAA